MSSNGVRIFHARANLEGSISVEQAEAHYRGQLTDAGWTPIERNAAETTAWSTWRFADGDENVWEGMLLIAKNPEAEGSLSAYLRASR